MKNEAKQPFQIFHLDEQDAGLSLGNVVKRKLPHWTWGQAREAILKRRVQVNGNLCLDQARKVTARDVLKVWEHALPKPVQASNIRFAFVDEFLVVVEKPAGVTSTRHFEERNLPQKRRQLQPTLEELLPEALEQYVRSEAEKRRTALDGTQPPMARKKRTKAPVTPKEIAQERERRLKRYSVVAVHRLDRDTSGLMIFARAPSIAQSLGKAFRNHDVVRKYHAVVHGHPAAQRFDSVLIRDRGDGKRGVAPTPETDDPTAQRAITNIRPIETIGEYSMIECQLETGRTHQIRIHLSEAGHMLCGEQIYVRRPDGTKVNDTSNAPRQALHSASLEFVHPITEEKLSFKMPWPADLYQWLQNLRKAKS